MQRLTIVILGLIAGLSAQSVLADEVVAATPDNTGGYVFGSGIGVLLGGAAGGPIGALLGAGLGAFAGAEVQQQSNLSGQAYRVKDADGSEQVVRSPTEQFQPGEQVNVQAGRLQHLQRNAQL